MAYILYQSSAICVVLYGSYVQRRPPNLLAHSLILVWGILYSKWWCLSRAQHSSMELGACWAATSTKAAHHHRQGHTHTQPRRDSLWICFIISFSENKLLPKSELRLRAAYMCVESLPRRRFFGELLSMYYYCCRLLLLFYHSTSKEGDRRPERETGRKRELESRCVFLFAFPFTLDFANS